MQNPPASAQDVADFLNRVTRGQADVYGDHDGQPHSAEQARADAEHQIVHTARDAAGAIRAYVVLNECEYADPDVPGGRSMALRIGALVLDPAGPPTALPNLMDALKALRPHGRLVGEVWDDGPFWRYARARGYRVLGGWPDPSPANPARRMLMVERKTEGTRG